MAERDRSPWRNIVGASGGQTRLVMLALGLLWPLAPAFGQGVNPAAVAVLEGQHPAEYFRRAVVLMQQKKPDDAVFAFYFGQLRYRRHLVARPDLPPDRDAALFASLMETVGRPVNQYAFGDVPRLVRSIDAVLAYDLKSPDRATPRAEFPQAHASVRAGLQTMKREIAARKAHIRAERARNGLPNRS